MSLIKKSKISVKFDKKKWEEFKNITGFDDNNKILEGLIEQKEDNDRKVKELKILLEESKKRNKKLEEKLIVQKKNEFYIKKKPKKSEIVLSNTEFLEKNYKKLKKEYDELKSNYNDLKSNPKIEEKIIYQEDTKIIKELKEKKDKLEAKVREKLAKIRKIEGEKKELESKLQMIEKKRAQNYGLLVRLDKDANSRYYSFIAEYLNSGEVNKLMRSKRDFSKYKRIKSPSLAILLEEPSETPRSIFLNSSKERSALNEISLPTFQYENLLDIEKKYNLTKEEFEELKKENKQVKLINDNLQEKYNEIKQELVLVKKNPIIREKVVYKENKKQLDELRLERDFLMSKIKKFEQRIHPRNAATIEVGERYKVKIDGVGHSGDFYTKINNLVIFVPEAKMNDELDIEITRIHKKYGFGRIIESDR